MKLLKLCYAWHCNMHLMALEENMTVYSEVSIPLGLQTAGCPCQTRGFWQQYNPHSSFK